MPAFKKIIKLGTPDMHLFFAYTLYVHVYERVYVRVYVQKVHRRV